MAITGTIPGTVTQHSSRFSFGIDYSYTQSIELNESYVTANVWFKTTSTANTWDTVGVRPCAVTINGNTKSESKRLDCNPWPSNPWTVMTHTVTVPHNSDGTKTITLSASVTAHAGDYGPSSSMSAPCTAQGQVTLQAIPRASRVSVSPTSVVCGNSFNVTVTPYANFSHAITVSLGSLSQNYTLTASASAKTQRVDIPVSWANSILTGMSATGRVSVQTKSGTTNIGSPVVVNVTMAVPAYELTGSSQVTGVDLFEGEYVQGHSKAAVAVTAASAYGAGITYETSYNGTTYTASSFTTGTLTASGDQTVRTTVRDTRGKSKVIESAGFHVYPYGIPVVTDVKPERNATDPSRVTIVVTGTAASINAKNTVTVHCGFGQTQLTPQTVPAGDFTVTFIAAGVDTNVTQMGTAYAEDGLSGRSVDYSWMLPTQAVTMDLLGTGDGVAFGKVAETPQRLDSAWPITAPAIILDTALPVSSGGTGADTAAEARINLGIADYIYPIGSIYMSVNNTNPQILFGGNWVAWGQGRVPMGVGSIVTNTDNTDGTISAGEISKTSAEIRGGSRKKSFGLNSGYAMITGSRARNDVSFTWKSTPTYTPNWMVIGNSVITDTSVIGARGDGVMLNGTTDSGETMQPYITCYMWKRTA